MPYLDERYAAQSNDDSEVLQARATAPQFSAGKVDYGRDPAWYTKDGSFTTNDLLPTAAMAVSGLAAGAAAGARGMGWEAIQRGGGELAKRYLMDPAERMFASGQNFIGGPDSGIPRWAQAALAAAGVGGGHALYSKFFGDKTPAAAPTNGGVGVSAPMAARTIQNRSDQIEAATDMNVLTREEFRAKWGQDPASMTLTGGSR
jgi:hypothetical protein